MDLIYAIVLLSSFASPGILALVLFFIWKARRKDHKGKSTVIPQYEPFEHIPPAVTAVVLKERIDIQDILATLIDLAQRGYVQVEYVRAATGQVFTEHNVTTNFTYALKLLKQPDAQLKNFESSLLKSIFTQGPTKYILNFLEDELQQIKPDLDKKIYTEAVRLGLIYESPEAIRQKYAKASRVVKIIGYVLFITGVGIPIIIDAFLIQWFGRHMPVRSPKGVEALRWSRGLELYITFAERYRLNRPSGELQTLLPEAMVFKLVKEWSQHVNTEKNQLPQWFQAPVESAGAVVRLVEFLSRT